MYEATMLMYEDAGSARLLEEVTHLVECGFAALPDVARIDHHRPGDPGYGKPPSEFMAASSIGQVIAALNELALLPQEWEMIDDERDSRTPGSVFFLEESGQWAISNVIGTGEDDHARLIPRDLVFVAAADHCLGAAARGDCPGVDPDALLGWRVEQRAKFQGRDPDEIMADIERAREALQRAPVLALEEWWEGREGYSREDFRPAEVRDMREAHTPELVDAALRDGLAYVALVTVDGDQKVVLGGNTTPAMVRAFMAEWAPAQGLTHIYGDPERGFAGGYVS
jgi:hypothetical protein